jgi:hypothetical protein
LRSWAPAPISLRLPQVHQNLPHDVRFVQSLAMCRRRPGDLRVYQYPMSDNSSACQHLSRLSTYSPEVITQLCKSGYNGSLANFYSLPSLIFHLAVATILHRHICDETTAAHDHCAPARAAWYVPSLLSGHPGMYRPSHLNIRLVACFYPDSERSLVQGATHVPTQPMPNRP